MSESTEKTTITYDKVKKIVGYIIAGLVGVAVALGLVKSETITSAAAQGEAKSAEIQQVMYTVEGVISTVKGTTTDTSTDSSKTTAEEKTNK